MPGNDVTREPKSHSKKNEASARGKLSTEAVVDAALLIAERQGFGGLSMRVLAASLGVSATALYHHVKNRNALLELCAERALGKVPQPDPKWGWKRRLKFLIIEQQRICLKYPGLSRYLVTHRDNSAADMYWIDSILDVLCRAGYDALTAIDVMISMSFVLNPTTLVEEIPRKQKIAMMNATSANKIIAKNPGKFPRAAEVLPLLTNFEGGGYFYEGQFETAVDRMIAGIAGDLKKR